MRIAFWGALALAMLLGAPCAGQADFGTPSAGSVAVDPKGKSLIGAGAVSAGALSAIGQTSMPVQLRGSFNLSWAMMGDALPAPPSPPVTVPTLNRVDAVLERSFDGGQSWSQMHDVYGTVDSSGVHRMSIDYGGVYNGIDCLSATCSTIMAEPEGGVLYRLRAIQIDSGSLKYRLSQ